MHFDYAQYKQKGSAPILVVVGILVLAMVAGGAYYFGKLPIKPTNIQPKACTQEAKQCPDGSFVGRTGSNCEFSPCPSVALKTPNTSPAPNGTGATANPDSIGANWKTYSNSDTDRGDQLGFAIKYPDYYQVMLGSDIVTRENIQIGIPYWFMKITRQEGTNDFVLIRTLKSVFSISQDIDKGIVFNDKVINGYTFKQYRAENFFEGIGNCNAYGYAIERNNIDYYNLYTCDKDVAIFDQMISTFKFTN